MKKDRFIIPLCIILILAGAWHFQSGGNTAVQTANVNADTQEKDYIKWVEFNVTCEAMKKAYRYDLDTYDKEVHLNWVSLLAYLGAKYGGDFTRYKEQDMETIAEAFLNQETSEEKLAAEMTYYAYYREAYGAVLDGMVGEYDMEIPVSTESGEKQQAEETTEDDEDKNTEEEGEGEAATKWEKVYGLKAFHPIAKGFPYSDYDDFGVSRTYGYRRNHLGHDMMSQVGTPVIAVESGYVAELGWNQYGGWRVGINSFDGKRYYYYAHLRQNRPYAEGLEKGDIVQAGDVIGYVGRTGYSAQENVNNIDEYHLHFGLQLIFDESQREGNNEIWVNGYELVKFLYQHQSEVQRNDETKEWTRVYQIKDSAAVEFKTGQEDTGE